MSHTLQRTFTAEGIEHRKSLPVRLVIPGLRDVDGSAPSDAGGADQALTEAPLVSSCGKMPLADGQKRVRSATDLPHSGLKQTLPPLPVSQRGFHGIPFAGTQAQQEL